MRSWRIPRLIISLILLPLSIAGCQEAPRRAVQAEYTPGQIIVKFEINAFDDRGELVSPSVQALNNRFKLMKMERLSAYTYVLEFPVEIDAMEIVRQYANDPLVVYAEPNYIIRATGTGEK